jgi:hypothetical protein
MPQHQGKSMPPAAAAGTPEADRIRSYLQVQAAKLSLPELIEKVQSDMQQVKLTLDTVPAHRFTERPAEDDWSANEVANHLVQTSRGVASGIKTVLDTGAQPSGVIDRMSASPEVRTADEWWHLLETDREAILARASSASGDEHLEVKWAHPVFGDLNWREWVLFMRVHDLDHARQLSAVVEAIGD